MTLYAHVSGATVDTVSALPRLYFDGTVWHDWRSPGPWRTQPSSAGWFPVTTTPRPADTDTTTHDLSVTLVNGSPVETWTPRPWTVEEVAARAAAANLAHLRSDIITKAIVWLEADSATAQTRATAISNAVSTVQTRKTQVQAFAFNGGSVSAINTQLNGSLKPLLIDILDYIIGLGNITSGLETWRGGRVDPALVWLARHQTDTTT